MFEAWAFTLNWKAPGRMEVKETAAIAGEEATVMVSLSPPSCPFWEARAVNKNSLTRPVGVMVNLAFLPSSSTVPVAV